MAAPTSQPDSSRWYRLWQPLAHHFEAVAFLVLAVLYLVPVWAFPYLPTQDGPSHLANALILRDYGHSAAGYETFFELRMEPLPNLTSHLLLAGLLCLVPPLIAEKVLVSLYVLGFAASFCYFLSAFGSRCRSLSWAGLLLVYPHYFWMGFWNYCLSLILLWVILGYVLRWRRAPHPSQAFVLFVLYTAAYFTHLAGFLLAVAGALGATVLVPPRRALAPVLVCLSALPPASLAMNYFGGTGFFRARSAMRLVYQPLERLEGRRGGHWLGKELADLDDELLASHAGSAVPSGLVLLAYLVLLSGLTAADAFRRPGEWQGPGPLFPALLGLLLLGAYLLVPNDLGLQHGGFVKTRLAPLPPLLWLACLREPAERRVRFLVRVLTVLLLAVNLVLVTHMVGAGNREVEQYTAGVEAVGRGHRLFVVQPYRPRPPSSIP